MHILALLLAVGAGIILPLQLAANARLGALVENRLAAAIMNFVVGLALLVVLAALGRTGVPDASKAAAVPWWGWIGGVFGATFVALSIYLSPKLGVVQWTVAIIAGQLAIAIVMDHYGWMGFAVREITWPRIAGVVLVLAGVVLVRAG